MAYQVTGFWVGNQVAQLTVEAANAKVAGELGMERVARKLGIRRQPIKLEGMSKPVMSFGGGLMVEVRRG